MIKNFEESVLFADTPDFDNRTPMQDVLFDIINTVNQRILKFYLSSESRNYDIRPPEMLIMVTANIFANLAHNIILTKDSGIKISAFNMINDELNQLTKKLFMTLETYYNADNKQIN